MGKKDKGIFRKIIVVIFLLFNLFAATALFFAFLSQWLSPRVSMLFTYCGLVFPYLIIANLFFIFFWIFIRYQYSFISLMVLLINVNGIDKYYQFNGNEKPLVCDNCIKVMSYNTRLFGVYDSEVPKEREEAKSKILNYLQEESPDIVCFQEFFWDKSGKLGFNTLDTLFPVLNINKKSAREKRQHHATYYPASLRDEYYFGLAIYSKYKIVNDGFVQFPDTLTTNGAMFADIKYKNDTIRVYCLHLESFKMDKTDYEIGEMLLNTDFNDVNFNKKALKISNKLTIACKKRAGQTNVVRAHIDSCRYPVIVCGDFNDTPLSYSYNKIAKKLKDSFRNGGEGRGITYHGDAFPAYRIDYILYSKRFSSFQHTVSEELTVSDHYPIYSYISIKKR